MPNLSAAELRNTKLLALDAGDIFGAAFEGGNTLPFLVTGADETTLHARAITSQFQLIFDRTNGEATEVERGQQCTWRIVTMQPLPLDIHQLMLSLDRRMRLGSDGVTNALDDGDKRALLYLDTHWTKYPI